MEGVPMLREHTTVSGVLERFGRGDISGDEPDEFCRSFSCLLSTIANLRAIAPYLAICVRMKNLLYIAQQQAAANQALYPLQDAFTASNAAQAGWVSCRWTL
jgi:hypothetical protein